MEKITEKEILTELYNFHKKREITAKLNLSCMEGINPNLIAGEFPSPIRGMKVGLTVADFRKEQEKDMNASQNTIKKIEKLLEESYERERKYIKKE